MGKLRSRAPVGSLNNMATKVRNQKAASQSKPKESQKFAKDSTSESEGSNSGSSSDSDDASDGSDENFDIEAARNKFTAKQASKRKASEKEKAKLVPAKPVKSTTPASAKSSTKATTTSPDESDAEKSHTSPSKETSPSTSSSAASSGDEDEDEAESESEAKEAGLEQSDEAGSESESSDAASEIESGSDSADESSNEQESAMDVDVEETAVSRVNGQSAAEDSASQVARPRWLNNSNFVLRKASSDNPAKEVADFFSKTNLEGKQVWYFTAPASLPITVLKDTEIDLSKAVTGDALLQHNGDDYGLFHESEATNTQIQLLIPSPAGDNYTTQVNRAVDSTVHLRRVAKFGPNGAISSTVTNEYTPIPKPIRQQPQNLKPRFTPIGVPTPTPPPVQSLKARPTSATQTDEESGSEVDSDEGMAEVPASPPPATPTRSKGSKKLSSVNGQLKRKHPGDEGDRPAPVQSSQLSEKSAKRSKTVKSSTSKVSSTKETPILPSTPALASNGAPLKASTSLNKDKTKSATKPPNKLTPVPVPIIPNMRR
ncbi:hypothetical protein Hte_007866 [Hypoxylon texense]